MVTMIIKVDDAAGSRQQFALADLSSSEITATFRFRPSGTVRTSLRDKFEERARAWQEATGHLSAPSRIYSAPTYHRLLHLGRGIIPLILEDMRDGAQCDWYNALRVLADFDPALSGLDPVTDAERGDADLMDAAWLRWGQDKGYID